ncbi:MAG: VPLPA-CTERM sorting domain-containing protein [Nitrospira sp.]|nr:VPLPA-CTERM sorting domain-containing protein [Nitrospira sp.]
MKVRGIKRIMVGAAVAVLTAVTGMAGQAQAFFFGQNDLVLAIYGNNTEALYNVGDFQTRLAGGATFSLDVSAGLAAAQVGGNPVKWTVFGWDATLDSGQIHAATKFLPDQINTAGLLDLTSQLNPAVAWSGFVTGMPFDGDTIAKSDARSFSSNLDGAGDGKLGGAWPVAMFGELDEILTIERGDVALNTYTQVGSALLTAGGLFTIGNPGPIPLPAGVVLFGTGLIGLVGIARRSFKRIAA